MRPLSTVRAGWTGSAGPQRAIGSSARCGRSGSYWTYPPDRSRMVTIVQSPTCHKAMGIPAETPRAGREDPIDDTPGAPGDRASGDAGDPEPCRAYRHPLAAGRSGGLTWCRRRAFVFERAGLGYGRGRHRCRTGRGGRAAEQAAFGLVAGGCHTPRVPPATQAVVDAPQPVSHCANLAR